MIKLFCSTLIACIIAFTHCHPNPSNPGENVIEKNCAGAATQSLALNLLKHNKNSNENVVFSPFGFSTILTFLSEGAKGDTFKQISTLLKHSSDIEKVRHDYNEVLKYLQGDNPLVAPQFRSWFYVYANNSIDAAYSKILAANYFVEVKEIQREIFDWNEPKTSIPLDIENKSNTKIDEIIGQEDEHIVLTTETVADSTTSVNSKDIIGFEDLKKSEPFDDEPAFKSNEPIVEKECSKFDETIEDKEYIEVPVDRKLDDVLDETRNEIIEDNEAIKGNEKLGENLKNANQIQDAPIKIRLPLKKLEDSLEIMMALESHPIRKRYFSSRTLGGHPGDIASALSGNSLVGEKAANENDVEGSGNNDGYESKMLMFNGLYFRGNWGIPFQQLRSDPENIFYVTPDVKTSITMMRSRGNFKVADLKEMGLQAIELPYENKRYSMLIILPNANPQQSLADLIESLNEDCFANIQSNLKEEMISLSLPKFRIESISRAEKSIIKSGVTDVFTPNADFGGITQEQKVHLEELVQHVTFRVDEGASSENFLTATEVLQERSAAADGTERNLSINRPFVYFVRDIEKDVILVAGLFSQPQVLDETPVVVDIAEDNDEK